MLGKVKIPGTWKNVASVFEDYVANADKEGFDAKGTLLVSIGFRHDHSLPRSQGPQHIHRRLCCAHLQLLQMLG